eukprot:10645758-Alexandrium_andersonii.AAC.1
MLAPRARGQGALALWPPARGGDRGPEPGARGLDACARQGRGREDGARRGRPRRPRSRTLTRPGARS